MNGSQEMRAYAVRFDYLGASFRALAEASRTQPRFVFQLRDPKDRRPTFSYVDLESTVIRPGGDDDAFSAMDRELARMTIVTDPALPPFQGGLFAMIGYDAAAGQGRKPPAAWPEFLFLRPQIFLAIDHGRGVGHVVALIDAGGAPSAALQARLAAVAKSLHALPETATRASSVTATVDDWAIDISPERYAAGVDRIKRLIVSGEAEQVIASIGLSKPTNAAPLDVFEAIIRRNPSPHAYLMEVDDFALIGSSPLLHIRCTDGKLTVETDGGTVPVGDDPVENERLERELLSSPKFRDELAGVVNATIDDLRPITEAGRIEVIAESELRRFSHVTHPYTVFAATLRAGVTAGDALIACSPAAAVVGRPKRTALATIDAIEGLARGPYGGVAVLLGANGDIEAAVILRSLWIAQGKAYLRSGGGIVRDSDAAAEYEECLHKARIVLESVAEAEACSRP